MSVDYVKNLSFQKRRFESIFRGYSNLTERADSHVSVSSNVGKKYIYIMTLQHEDISTLISGTFSIDLNYETNKCVLSYGVEEKIDCDENGVLQIGLNHPFLSQWFSVYIAKDIDEDILSKSFDFFTYKVEELKTLQKLKIKSKLGYEGDICVFRSVEEIKEFLGRYEPKYRLKPEKVSANQLPHFNNVRFDELVSLKIIKLLNDDWQKNLGDLLELCEKIMIEKFSVPAEEILGYFLCDGEFYRNFVYVEIYFAFMDGMKKNINGYQKKYLAPSLEWMKSNLDEKASLYNALSNDEGIVGIDKYLKEKTNELIEKLEAFR